MTDLDAILHTAQLGPLIPGMALDDVVSRLGEPDGRGMLQKRKQVEDLWWGTVSAVFQRRSLLFLQVDFPAAGEEKMSITRILVSSLERASSMSELLTRLEHGGIEFDLRHESDGVDLITVCQGQRRLDLSFEQEVLTEALFS